MIVMLSLSIVHEDRQDNTCIPMLYIFCLGKLSRFERKEQDDDHDDDHDADEDKNDSDHKAKFLA